MTFGKWAAHQTVFSVACNSDSEILAALQTMTVKAVVTGVPKVILLAPISFWCCRVVEPGKDFVAIWIIPDLLVRLVGCHH